MNRNKLNSTIVGISAWGFILGMIALRLSGKIQMDLVNWIFFIFLCIVGIGAAAQNEKK